MSLAEPMWPTCRCGSPMSPWGYGNAEAIQCEEGTHCGACRDTCQTCLTQRCCRLGDHAPHQWDAKYQCTGTVEIEGGHFGRPAS